MTAIEGLQSALNGLWLKAGEARLESLLEQASKKEPSYADAELLGCGVDARRSRSACQAATRASAVCKDLRSVRFCAAPRYVKRRMISPASPSVSSLGFGLDGPLLHITS